MTNEKLKKIKDDCILRNFRTKEIRIWVKPDNATLVTSYIKVYKEEVWVDGEEGGTCCGYDFWNEIVKVYYWMSHFIHVPKYSEPWIENEARGFNW